MVQYSTIIVDANPVLSPASMGAVVPDSTGAREAAVQVFA